MQDTQSATERERHHEPIESSSIAEAFATKDGMRRQSARGDVEAMGEQAVPGLIACLSDPRRQVRWEAAKTLIKIADPAAAGALVNALEDADGDVRWLAAVALTAIGREALRPLFMALIDDADRDDLRHGAHHVCHELVRTDLSPIVKPVLDALETAEPTVAVPTAAYNAVHAL